MLHSPLYAVPCTQSPVLSPVLSHTLYAMRAKFNVCDFFGPKFTERLKPKHNDLVLNILKKYERMRLIVPDTAYYEMVEEGVVVVEEWAEPISPSVWVRDESKPVPFHPSHWKVQEVPCSIPDVDSEDALS